MNTKHKANSAQALDILINRVGDYIRRHEGIKGSEWSPEAQRLMAGFIEAIEIDKTQTESVRSIIRDCANRANGECNSFCEQAEYHAGQDSVLIDMMEQLTNLTDSWDRRFKQR